MIRKFLDQASAVSLGVLRDFRDLLAPPVCVSCEDDLPENDDIFCDSCLESLRAKSLGRSPICPFCGSHNIPNENCPRCNKPETRMRLYYWASYADEVVSHILGFKYHGVLELGKRLTKEALKKVGDQLRKNHYHFILPVPLHSRRLRKRDYNQSEIIAEIISRELGVEQVPDSVLRVKSTRPQAKIDNEDKRWKNVQNAFSLSPENIIDFSGKRILIVDDIVTTGATIFETARPIRERKPEFIDIFCLAYAG